MLSNNKKNIQIVEFLIVIWTFVIKPQSVGIAVED